MGMDEWQTQQATASGFSRGVEARRSPPVSPDTPRRFAVAYHLLSLSQQPAAAPALLPEPAIRRCCRR
jgi:hypothetical protein